MKLKYLIIAITISMFFGFTDKAFAKEIYYTNKNNVSFTKEEYDFLNLMFWDGSQDLFTLEDYQKLIDSNIMNRRINVSYNKPAYMPLSTIIDDSQQTLKIATACDSKCLVTLTKTWKYLPSNPGYDVMGVRLDNVSLLNTPKVLISNAVVNNIQISDKGFGSSIMLPNSNTRLVVSQIFNTTTGGPIYGIYQHAMSYISCANSQKYTIASNGYGSVFLFSGVAQGIYEKSTGINIAV